MATITLTSDAFRAGEPIPSRHAHGEENLSPPLKWSGVPGSARSLALICDDPDAPAGTWVHWAAYGIPAEVTELAEGIPAGDSLPTGGLQGRNDFGETGYGGPWPPPGNPHRYFFRIYALDAHLDLPPGATKKELLQAMEGHSIAEGELMGTYQR